MEGGGGGAELDEMPKMKKRCNGAGEDQNGGSRGRPGPSDLSRHLQITHHPLLPPHRAAPHRTALQRPYISSLTLSPQSQFQFFVINKMEILSSQTKINS